MFDVGFSELLLIGLVALVVLGPERLPKAARYVGLWLRRARGHWYSVRAELERELAAEDMRRSLDETRAALQQSQDDVQREFDAMRDAVTTPPDADAGTAHDAQADADTDADVASTEHDDGLSADGR